MGNESNCIIEEWVKNSKLTFYIENAYICNVTCARMIIITNDCKCAKGCTRIWLQNYIWGYI